VISAAAFVATKLVAFAGRGRGDYLFSHDLGDIISVVDGRESLVSELSACHAELRLEVAASVVARLMTPRSFLDSLPGHLPGNTASQERLPDLLSKLRHIAALAAN